VLLLWEGDEGCSISPDTGQHGGFAPLKAQSQIAHTSGEAGTGHHRTCFIFMKNHITTLRLSALACACASSVAGFAQTVPELKEVVITASRTEQRVQDALPATTLITREDIERIQTPDLPTLLRQVTGVEIAQNGGPGTLASAFLRGGASRHALVLIDGVPVNTLNFGLPSLEHLPLANVERIEIVRGNVSALYGSAALGGVIQIFTKEATGVPQLNVTGQVGSRGLRQMDASGTVKLASGTRLSATLQELKDGGFNAIDQSKIAGTNPDVDGYKCRALSLGVSQDIGAATVGLRVRDARGTTQYDSGYGPATQADESKFVESGAALSFSLRASENLTVKAALTDSADKLNAEVTASPYFVNSKSRGANVGADWSLDKAQRVTAGFENTRQSINSDTVYVKDSRKLDSVRLGYQADVERHQFQLNLRHDKYSDFGSASTYFAGYGFRITDAWRVNASMSTGFNAPTFNDLFYPGGGNPNLKPERLKSRELGVQYTASSQELRALYFSNHYKDLIGSDPTFTYYTANIDSSQNNGVEVSYLGRFGSTTLRAGATSQNPIDITTGKRLLRRAKNLANVGISQDMGAWSFGGDWRYSGTRQDRYTDPATFSSTIVTLPSYRVINLTTSYAINKEFRAFGRIENALNKSYETVYGYNQPQRGFFVGLSWMMK
jgi:vitamin B12 transporter